MWWAIFGLSSQTSWTFAMYGIVLLQTVLLYLASGLILPDADPAGSVDLDRSYYANAGWFFGLTGAAAVVSIGKELVIEGRLPEAGNLVAHLLLIGASAAGALSRARWLHLALAPLVAAGFILYIALLFARL